VSSHPESPAEFSLRGRPVSRAAVACVRLYQRSLSRFFGGQCKFVPTCSQYCVEAVIRKGVFRGLALGAWRICRCNPLCPGGYDPVD